MSTTPMPPPPVLSSYPQGPPEDVIIIAQTPLEDNAQDNRWIYGWYRATVTVLQFQN